VTSLITRFQQLLPAIEVVTSQSSVVVRCYEYKETIEKHIQWLTEVEEKLKEDMPLDIHDPGYVLLHEQEVSCFQFHVISKLYLLIQNSE